MIIKKGEVVAKAETTFLGKVTRIEGGIAFTDKKQKSIAVCKVGDVLVLDNKTRKVSVQGSKLQAQTSAQAKKELADLQNRALELEIDGAMKMDIDELKAAIAAEDKE